jgi:hypothetical protein
MFGKKKDRKKFKDTKVGAFLKEKGSKILDVAGDLLPDKGGLGIIKNLIDNDNDMSAEDKEFALKMLEYEVVDSQEVTKRWQSDMSSDSWLSKNARPIVLLAFVGMLFVFMLLDSMNIKFDVKERWISLYEITLVTVVAAYFGARQVGKYHKVKYGKSKN